MGEIGSGNYQVLAGLIDAADNDVRVRVGGVEVIDRDPVEPGSEIALDLSHQITGEGAEVGELGAVLGGNDQPELTRVTPRAIEKGAAIGAVRRGGVELAGGTLTGDAVPLEVAQMHRRRAAPGPHLHIARLDDDTARSGPRLRPAPW